MARASARASRGCRMSRRWRREAGSSARRPRGRRRSAIIRSAASPANLTSSSHIRSWTPMPASAASSSPRSTIYAPADRMLRGNLWQLGLILLGAIAAALVGGELFVLRPVHELTAVIKRTADGDLASRVALTRGVRELGALGDAFNAMTAK